MRLAIKKQSPLESGFMKITPDPVITYDHMSDSEDTTGSVVRIHSNRSLLTRLILEESLIAGLGLLYYLFCIY